MVQSVPAGGGQLRPKSGLQIMDTEFRYECEECDRAFSTPTGLGLHRRRAHPQAFNRGICVGRTKRRWSPEELQMLAECEVRLIREGGREGLAQRLVRLAGGRTLDAIKGVRKREDYRQLVAAVIGAGGTEASSGSGGWNLGASGVAVEAWEEALRLALRRDSDAIAASRRVSHSGDLLVAAVGEVMVNRDPTEQILQWWRGLARTGGTEGNGQVERPREVRVGAPTRRRLRRTQYASIQELWKKDRKAAVGRILGGGRDLGDHSMEEIREYWAPIFETASAPWGGDEGLPDVGWGSSEVFAPVDDDELLGSRPGPSTSAGPDGIVPRDWDLVPLVMKRIVFNLFMLRRELPGEILEAATTFIPKVLHPLSPGDYRPITVASVVVRHFHKLLVGRLRDLCAHLPAQRGFVPGVDGVGDNVVRLNAILKKAWKSRRELLIVSLDVAKAFDSVSHEAVLRLLGWRGAPPAFVEYVRSCLARSSLRMRWGGARSGVVRVGRGVRQGDPMSPFLFNLIMDYVLGGLPEKVGFRLGAPGQRVNAMAYADDVLLFASSEIGMRALLRAAASGLADCGLAVNPEKSWLLYLNPSGRQKLLKVDSDVMLQMGGHRIPTVGVADSVRYLGVPFGPKGVLEAAPRIEEKLALVSSGPLKPQQKLEVVRDFVLPGTYHELVLGRVRPTDLAGWDVRVRAHVRRWLHLPHDVPNAYIHASITNGGLGIPELSRLVPVWRRTRRECVMALWEDGVAEELAAEVREVGGLESVEAVRREQQADLYGKIDGRDLEESALVKASNSWRGARAAALSGREFVQFVRLHAGCLPSAMRMARGRRGQQGSLWCRAGCSCAETVAHVIQVCPLTKGGRILRHHAVVRLLAGTFERRRFGVYHEVTMALDGVRVRPDLVITKGSRAWILDVQVVSPRGTLIAVNSRKRIKYDTPEIREMVRELTGKRDVGVVAVTISWKGIWCARSARDLGALGVSKRVLEWATERVLRGSHTNWTRWNVLRGGERAG